jgi:hypothetical protein
MRLLVFAILISILMAFSIKTYSDDSLYIGSVTMGLDHDTTFYPINFKNFTLIYTGRNKYELRVVVYYGLTSVPDGTHITIADSAYFDCTVGDGTMIIPWCKNMDIDSIYVYLQANVQETVSIIPDNRPFR